MGRERGEVESILCVLIGSEEMPDKADSKV